MRIKYEGIVNVFRNGSYRDTLSATIKLSDGREFYWDICPKSISDLFFFGGPAKSNLFKVAFTASQEGRNPRSVKFLGDVTST